MTQFKLRFILIVISVLIIGVVILFTQEGEASGHPDGGGGGWDQLIQCESTGNPAAVSPDGLYHGLYQFWQPTWDGLAAQIGRPDLIGLPPSQASVADQTQMAHALFERDGASPWPVCGRFLVTTTHSPAATIEPSAVQIGFTG